MVHRLLVTAILLLTLTLTLLFFYSPTIYTESSVPGAFTLKQTINVTTKTGRTNFNHAQSGNIRTSPETSKVENIIAIKFNVDVKNYSEDSLEHIDYVDIESWEDYFELPKKRKKGESVYDMQNVGYEEFLPNNVSDVLKPLDRKSEKILATERVVHHVNYTHSIMDMVGANVISQHKKASNHHANLPLEMYSFTL